MNDTEATWLIERHELSLIGHALCDRDFAIELVKVKEDAFDGKVAREVLAALRELVAQKEPTDFVTLSDRLAVNGAPERLGLSMGWITGYLTDSLNAWPATVQQLAESNAPKQKINFDAYVTHLTSVIFTQFERDKTMDATMRRKVIRSIRKQVIEASTRRALDMYFKRLECRSLDIGRLEHVKPFMVEVDSDN